MADAAIHLARELGVTASADTGLFSPDVQQQVVAGVVPLWLL